MKKRILQTIVALLAIVGSASAQSLSVQTIEVQAGEQTEVVVSLTGATAMTALQFNLQLPKGVTANTDGATLGAATNSHTLSVETLDGGNLLFVLYSMDLNTFSDGELLRIPVAVSDEAKTGSGTLYTVRTATPDAVSHQCANAPFTVTVKETPTSIDNSQLKIDNSDDAWFSIDGVKLSGEPKRKGVYIRKGKKVVK